MPTILGRNQLAHPSGTIPLLANTKPNLDFFTAMRISAANCIVAPTPTASPLHAAITGFKELYIFNVNIPPASLL